jgi:hypothetical protein
MTSTTPEGLAERLEAAAKTATPGPWFADDHPLEIVAPHVSLVVASIDPLAEDAEEAAFNAAFIALANPKNILALIQALRSSEEQRDRMRGALEREIEALEEELDSARQDLVDKSVESRLRGDVSRADLFLEASVIVGQRATDFHTERALSQHQEKQGAAHEKGPAG